MIEHNHLCVSPFPRGLTKGWAVVNPTSSRWLEWRDKFGTDALPVHSTKLILYGRGVMSCSVALPWVPVTEYKLLSHPTAV